MRNLAPLKQQHPESLSVSESPRAIHFHTHEQFLTDNSDIQPYQND
jgi:hypothetical protein